MCGKYADIINIIIGIAGSPPHVREVRKESVLIAIPIRITPACAGSTYYSITKKQKD